MTLGFSVDDLLPRARGGGVLKMGLAKLGLTALQQEEPMRACKLAEPAE